MALCDSNYLGGEKVGYLIFYLVSSAMYHQNPDVFDKVSYTEA